LYDEIRAGAFAGPPTRPQQYMPVVAVAQVEYIPALIEVKVRLPLMTCGVKYTLYTPVPTCPN
jgi:hypothetical protein